MDQFEKDFPVTFTKALKGDKIKQKVKGPIVESSKRKPKADETTFIQQKKLDELEKRLLEKYSQNEVDIIMLNKRKKMLIKHPK